MLGLGRPLNTACHRPDSMQREVVGRLCLPTTVRTQAVAEAFPMQGPHWATGRCGTLGHGGLEETLDQGHQRLS